MARVVETPGGRFSNAGSAAAVNAIAAVNSPSGASNAPAPYAAPNSPAAPAPAPGPTPGAGDPPNEGIYGQYSAQALDAYSKAQTAIQARRSGIYQSYGFNQNDGSVDGNNMVGLYQQMKHNQALELQSAENQALDRGLGTHGLGAQVAEAPRFQEDADAANLGNSYLGSLDANSQELSGAGSVYQQALIDARRLQVEDDIANQRYDAPPATPPPAGDSTPNPAANATPGARALSTAARIAATTKGKKPLAPVAVKVTANKTGASANKKQGIFSTH